MKKWTVIATQEVLRTPWFNLRQEVCQLPTGVQVSDYYVMSVPDVAMIVAVTPQQELLLVEQYKHGYGDILTELPAGMCESDDPLADAQRELREETGYTSVAWQSLGTFIASPTRSHNHVHVFLAEGATHTHAQQFDANEQIQVRRLPLRDARKVMARGEVRVLDSVLGLYRALDHLGF